MDPDRAIEIGQEAIIACLTLAAPFLIVGILVAIVLGVIQSLTHTQDQTVSFVPKIFFIGVTFIICLPWFSERIVEYSRDWLERPVLMTIPVRETKSAFDRGGKLDSVTTVATRPQSKQP